MAEQPAQWNIHADRQVWFIRKYAYLGRDFTGGTFLMQVRQTKDSTGTPLLDLANGNIATDTKGIGLLYAGTDTIANHIAAGRLLTAPINPTSGLPYANTDSVLLSLIEIFASKGFMQAFPYPAEHGDDLVAYYDLIIATPSEVADVVQAGSFILRAGVTLA